MWQGLKDVAICLLNVNLKFGTMIYQGEALNTFTHSSNNIKGFYRIATGFYSFMVTRSASIYTCNFAIATN